MIYPIYQRIYPPPIKLEPKIKKVEKKDKSEKGSFYA